MIHHILLSCLICLCILSAGCTALEKSQENVLHNALLSEESGSSLKEAPVPAPAEGYRASSSELYKSADDLSKSGGPDNKPLIEQKIIKTANIQIEVSDVQKTSDQIGSIAEKASGIIQSSSLSAGQNDQYSGTITIRIPSARFDSVLTDIQILGKLVSSSISAEDVTEEYVDLAAQKAAFTNQLEQYNRILTQAVNVTEILEVQREIERVQVEIDRITGRMKYLDNRISFSTITIRISEPAQVVTSSGYSFASVISDGISGFTDTLVWLIVAIMTLLPLIIIGGIGYLIYRRVKLNKTG